jgi:ATP-binding cassette, subfamily B, bacterial
LPTTSSSRWARAVGLVRPALAATGLIIAASLLMAAANAVEPLILKRLIDGLSAGNSGALVYALGLLLALVVGREVIQALSNWLTWRTRLRLHYRLLEATVGRLHALPLSYHQRQGVGATMTLLDRGIQGFIGAFHQVALSSPPAVAYLCLSFYFMMELNWKLAVVVLAFAPLPAIIGKVSAPVQTGRERVLLERWARIYARFNEVLASIAVVKSFTREEAEKHRFLRDVGAANREVERGVGFDSSITAAHNLVVGLARIAALGAGGLLVGRGEISVGTLVAFLGYAAGLFGPVNGLTSVYQAAHRASVSLDTILSILDARDSVTDAPTARVAVGLRGDVRFEGVHFSYPGSRRELLGGIDLHIRAGERVAVVGPSGVGKTTLIALLQRFYDPTAGRVAVDGHDLRDLTQQSLRKHIGVVQQESLLFNDTIRNNIAYGNPDACDVAICEAARHANAHEMILRLADGYESLAGERGARLSAGERQRIAIARALLKNPSIVVLDEATAALDAETEALVQEAVNRLTRERTTIIIAHRLSTVVSADRIVVLRDGTIHEQGTHGALMRAGGYYASLVARQVGGLLQTG